MFSMEDDGFVVVTGKRNRRNRGVVPKWTNGKLQLTEKQLKNVSNTMNAFAPEISTVNEKDQLQKHIEMIQTYSKEIEDLPFFTTMVNQLKERSPFAKMICYGIGCIHDSAISQYQYACACSLHSTLQIASPMEIFDPVMDIMDARIIQKFNGKILCTNEMGKRRIEEPTLFFMPHCGFSLYNGVIWSNWGSNLQNVTIVGNQFAGYDKLILNEEKRTSPSNCILPLLSYFTDYPLLTDVTKVSTYSNRLLYDAFHSTSVQFVPAEAYEKGAKEGLWEQQPEEPETENDISTDVNSELVDFLKRQEEDGLWTESAGDCSSDFSSLIGSRTKYPVHAVTTEEVVYIYKDTGCSFESADMLKYSLSKLLPCKVQFISGDELVQVDWREKCCLFVMPGGAAKAYFTKLSENGGNDLIRQYVMNGGRYLGICAGAYYACSSVDFEGEVHGSYGLDFFHGTAKGPALRGYDSYSTVGSYAAPFTFQLNETTYHAKSYFKGGPYFIPEGEPCVLARYEKQDALICEDAIGCIQCSVGSGKAVLCAFHVEFDPWQMQRGVGLDSIVEELREQTTNDNRMRFLHWILTCLELPAGDMCYLD